MKLVRHPSRDFFLLLSTRSVRAFAFGFSAVTVAIHLQARGLTATQIGVALAIGIATGSLSGLALAAIAARIGRRLAISLCGLLMVIAGLDLALAHSTWLLILAGVTGMLGLSTDLGPFASVEQAALTDTVPERRRNRAFARYSALGALAAAAGSLAAGIAQRNTGAGYAVFAGLGAVTVVLPLLLSTKVEAPQAGGPVFGDLRPLAGLAALFCLDAFGGGLVANAVIVFWLHVRFGASLGILGPAFAGLALVQAASYEAAGRLGDRFGLINTMVFTHLPSNLLLIVLPFSPSLWVALGLLLVQFSLSEMDVPTRQAYIVSIVPPSERAGAVASTGALRGIAQAFGPILAGAAIQAARLGLPFIVGGGVKAAYDLMLYAAFRNRKAEHETRI